MLKSLTDLPVMMSSNSIRQAFKMVAKYTRNIDSTDALLQFHAHA